MAQEQSIETILHMIREIWERDRAIEPSNKPAPAQHNADTPFCDRCGNEMSQLATLARIVDRPMLQVFKCNPCSRITAIH